jgi:uncharacterized protein YwqG
MMPLTEEALTALARRHLPAAAAERWAALLRPAARLLPAQSPGDPIVGHLGGLPRLPAGTAWPVWEGHGPLSLVATVDCAALPGGALDIPLPGSGTLLFFFFGGRADDHEACVDYADPATRDGARVLYVPSGAAADWRLLAQFGSDEATGMEWADGGVLYWTIRPDDLAARRFDRAMLTWQST